MVLFFELYNPSFPTTKIHNRNNVSHKFDQLRIRLNAMKTVADVDTSGLTGNHKF